MTRYAEMYCAMCNVRRWHDIKDGKSHCVVCGLTAVCGEFGPRVIAARSK